MNSHQNEPKVRDERLVLGTVQLGMPYGIANKTGQPNHTTATEIIRKAWESGIREFDTSQGYGDSETVLGQAFAVLGIAQKVLVISKFDPQLNHLDAKALSTTLDQSLQRLGILSLYGIMLHREQFLLDWDQGLGNILRNCVQTSRVQHIGISVYSPEKAIQALNTKGIDFVQLPTNILDRRFEKAKVFELARKKQKRIYIRSVFLQGLPLIELKELPEKMSFAKPTLERFHQLCKKLKLHPQELAMGYIKMAFPECQVIFGVECIVQLQHNLQCWLKNDYPKEMISSVKQTFQNVDEQIVNSSLWPR